MRPCNNDNRRHAVIRTSAACSRARNSVIRTGIAGRIGGTCSRRFDGWRRIACGLFVIGSLLGRERIANGSGDSVVYALHGYVSSVGNPIQDAAGNSDFGSELHRHEWKFSGSRLVDLCDGFGSFTGKTDSAMGQVFPVYATDREQREYHWDLWLCDGISGARTGQAGDSIPRGDDVRATRTGAERSKDSATHSRPDSVGGSIVRTNIHAGKLLRRGQLQRIKSTVVPDASGHVDLTKDANWEFVQNRWFSIVPSGSKQFLLGDQLRADVTHQITMRYDSMSSSVTKGWRLQHRGTTYNFSGPPVDRNLDRVLLDFPAVSIPSV